MSLSVFDLVMLVVILISGCEYIRRVFIAITYDWRHRHKPTAAPEPAPLLVGTSEADELWPYGERVSYWAGPKDGVATAVEWSQVSEYYGEHYPSGVYRRGVWLDRERRCHPAYVWRERPLPAVDWSDLERDN